MKCYRRYSSHMSCHILSCVFPSSFLLKCVFIGCVEQNNIIFQCLFAKRIRKNMKCCRQCSTHIVSCVPLSFSTHIFCSPEQYKVKLIEEMCGETACFLIYLAATILNYTLFELVFKWKWFLNRVRYKRRGRGKRVGIEIKITEYSQISAHVHFDDRAMKWSNRKDKYCKTVTKAESVKVLNEFSTDS